MRILFFSEQFWPETNAPAIHVHERARIWARDGHAVTVITSAPNFPMGRVFPGFKNAWRTVDTIDGIRVVRVKTFISPNKGILGRSFDFLSYAISALFFSFFEHQADVVISTSPQLLVPLAGLLCAKIRRTPHVFELRDLWPASIVAVGAAKPGLALRGLEKLELCLYKNSNRVFAFTEAFRRDLIRRGIPPEHVIVTPNGTDLTTFYPRPKDQRRVCELGLKDRWVVGYFGTLGLAHGLENLIETARLLQDTPITLLLAGPGAAKEDLEVHAREAGVTSLIFLPSQPRESMPSLWSVCDVALVHLKDNELFRTVIPSKLYEATAMGLPICYSGPTGEASELLESSGTGIVVPAENPLTLAAALRRLWQDSELLTTLRAAAVATRQNYSREQQAHRTVLLLDETSQGAPSGSV